MTNTLRYLVDNGIGRVRITNQTFTEEILSNQNKNAISCVFIQIVFQKCKFEKCTFLQSTLNDAEISETTFQSCFFQETAFPEADIFDSQFVNSEFKKMDTSGQSALIFDSKFLNPGQEIILNGGFDFDKVLAFLNSNP